MKKSTNRKAPDELRANYNFSGAVRGKHAARYAEGTNVVFLAPDVARVFKNSESVNAALRNLIEIAGNAMKSA